MSNELTDAGRLCADIPIEVEDELKPYRPSNGSEGLDFKESFCFRCAKYGTDENPCEIEGASFLYDVTDPRYPKEWVAEDGWKNPRCTAFVSEENEQ